MRLDLIMAQFLVNSPLAASTPNFPMNVYGIVNGAYAQCDVEINYTWTDVDASLNVIPGTQVSLGTLRYQFTIDDPTTWTAPWTAEYAWPLTSERIYEYACHEGNYALGNILRGARVREGEDVRKTRQQ